MSVKIILQNFSGSYYPGNTISGHVVCVFESRKEFRGIRVRLRGKEHTSWWERESYYDSTEKKTKYHNVSYTGDNTIISYDTTLLGEGILSGRHEYPFSFTLPTDLPATYDGNYGHIRYYVKANVDIPYAFDFEDERSFNLISLIDFNNITGQLTLNPVDYEDENNLCCCCCASDPITMKVHFEKEAFVLGEVAKIKVDLTNMSNTSLDGLNIKLNMMIESKATSPKTSYKNDSELITSTSETGVGAHGQRTYEFDLEIPRTLVLPNFNRSSLFKKSCELVVEAEIPGCHDNMDITASIELGHIPLSGAPNALLPRGAFVSSTTNIPGGAFPSNPPQASNDCKPPPYSTEDAAPPYPVGAPAFPTAAVPSQIGFKVPGAAGESSPSLAARNMPVPVHAPLFPGPSSSAPPDQSAPSAPSKAELAEADDFTMVNDESSDPPPPTYQDVLRGPSFPNTPGTGSHNGPSPPYPPGPSGPSAPPL